MNAVALFPAMGNRLKELRNSKSWTLEKAADEMAVSRSQYIKLERGERRLTADYINKAASVFGVSASDIIADPEEVPIMGYVGAGAEVEPDFEQVPPEGLDQVTVPFPLPADMVAFKVQGTSMQPQYRDGTLIVVFREQRRAIETFYGEEAVVRTEDGRRFIKTILRGQRGVTLSSWNADPIENVRLNWIGEIFAVLPPTSFRRMVKQGGIQGRLGLKKASI